MTFISQAEAYRRAERLKYHIEKYGVPCVIQLRTGAGGKHWGVDTHLATLGHHIVSRPTQGKTPLYSLVRNGRGNAPGAPAVPGPLANNYGGFDMVARIITMGLANHPGKGGPVVANGHRIPKDNGRYYMMGWEFEGGLNADDWPPAYHDFMAKCLAGNIDYLDEMNSHTVDERSHFEHSTWANGRKIDRLDKTLAVARAEIKAVRQGGTLITTPVEEDDVLTHFVFEAKDAKGRTHQYFFNPRSWTHQYIGGTKAEANKKKEDYATVVKAVGDKFEVHWASLRPGGKTDTLGAVDLLGTYVGPAEFRPVGG